MILILPESSCLESGGQGCMATKIMFNVEEGHSRRLSEGFRNPGDVESTQECVVEPSGFLITKMQEHSQHGFCVDEVDTRIHVCDRKDGTFRPTREVSRKVTSFPTYHFRFTSRNVISMMHRTVTLAKCSRSERSQRGQEGP